MDMEHIEHAWQRANGQQIFAIILCYAGCFYMCKNQDSERLNDRVGSLTRFSDS